MCIHIIIYEKCEDCKQTNIIISYRGNVIIIICNPTCAVHNNIKYTGCYAAKERTFTVRRDLYLL